MERWLRRRRLVAAAAAVIVASGTLAVERGFDGVDCGC